MISIQNLSKKFGSKTALQHVSMGFHPGTVYGIVGENGAGKTTLFRCIAGLEQFDGTVTSNHMPLKNHLGFLMTDPFFFRHLTGMEYLQLLCNARHKPLLEVEAKNIFDLPLDQYATTYSTGMKKKLALTAILLQENKYFILDEPFNGVDIQSNVIITELIQHLKKLGKIVVLSSHIFSTLHDTCDEIYLLHQGTVTRKVLKPEFPSLEAEMKAVLVGNKIERLQIR